jgi:uncharacterized protein (TIGR02246 family)
MKNIALRIFAVVLSASMTSGWAQDLDRAQVEVANSAWTSAFNSKNVDQITTLYTDDALLLAAGDEAIKGKEKIADHWRKVFDRNHDDQIAFEIIDVHREGGIVYVVGRFQGSYTSEGQKNTFSGNNLRILEPTEAGVWKTRVHIYNLHE